MALIPGCPIIWAPECVEPLKEHAGKLLDLTQADDELYRRGEYSVPHYGPASWGQALGPLSLDQTLQFCHVLSRQVARAQVPIVVATAPGDIAERANKAVLLGAYLLLGKAWTLQAVCEALPEECLIGFPCSWHARGTKPSKREPLPEVCRSAIMKVKDVWAAFELACNKGWVASGDELEDEIAVNLMCSKHRRTMLEYDAAWIVPSSVIVAADPTTTVRDPNPTTCSSLDRPETKNFKDGRPSELSLLSEDEMSDFDFMSPTMALRSPRWPMTPLSPLKAVAAQMVPSTVDTTPEPDAANNTTSATQAPPLSPDPDSNTTAPCPPTEVRFPQIVSIVPVISEENALEEAEWANADLDSCHTVCKFQSAEPCTPRTVARLAGGNRKAPKDFISWCKGGDVGTVVRVNLENEAGIVEYGGSYKAETFRKHAIQQVDVPVVDKFGGVPGPRDVAKVISRCNLNKTDGHDRRAIMVHCKGGFGRSVVFACCIVIWEQDVPGVQMLAWARIVRPGAITTLEQERFLCAISGREDLRKYTKAGQCCAVQ